MHSVGYVVASVGNHIDSEIFTLIHTPLCVLLDMMTQLVLCHVNTFCVGLLSYHYVHFSTARREKC